MPVIRDQNEINPFKHSVPLTLDWDSNHPLVDSALDELIEVFEDQTIKRRVIKKHLKAILIACVRAKECNPTIYLGYVRNNNYTNYRKIKNPLKLTSRTLKKVIDTLTLHGYLIHFKGDNKTGYSSRFKSTDKLQDIIRSYTLENIKFTKILCNNGIILKDENKSIVYNYIDTDKTLHSKAVLKAYNTLIANSQIKLSHNASGSPYYFDQVWSYRVFNNSSFEQGGRFYGNWWCNCKKEDRENIFINGQETIELDYKANHLWLIYALKNKPMPSIKSNDPYKIDNTPRDLMKKIFLISLNATSHFKAYASILQEINYIHDNQKREEFKRHIKTKNDFNKVLKTLINKHPVIENYLCTGYGIHLQYLDSQIAEFVLQKMTALNIPTLCIHDSFIAPLDKQIELYHHMREAYEFLGYPNHIPKIE